MKPAISTMALLCLGVLCATTASAALPMPPGCGPAVIAAGQEDGATTPKPIEPPQEAEPDC